MLSELKRLALIEPVSYSGYNPKKVYFYEKYTLQFAGIWKLVFNHKIIITESLPTFWKIIEMYDFKPFIVADTIGEDTISKYTLEPIQDKKELEDTNFWPSLRGDWQEKTNQPRPFPIWEWNEYIDTNLMSVYEEVM